MPNYDLIWQSIQIRWILKVTSSAETLHRYGFCNYIKIDNTVKLIIQIWF